MADRIQWTENNQSLIDRIASDPISCKEWHDVSEPWCFLAACLEWKALFIDKTKTTSGLPCGIDATCSGLQHLSALTLCGDTAALVNVSPTEKPADAYRTVAEAALKHMPEVPRVDEPESHQKVGYDDPIWGDAIERKELHPNAAQRGQA